MHCQDRVLISGIVPIRMFVPDSGSLILHNKYNKPCADHLTLMICLVDSLLLGPHKIKPRGACDEPLRQYNTSSYAVEGSQSLPIVLANLHFHGYTYHLRPLQRSPWEPKEKSSRCHINTVDRGRLENDTMAETGLPLF